MDFGKVEKVINPALRTFFERDRFLLEHDVNELAITHKLASYIQSCLCDEMKKWGDDTPEYVVDCEYNREGDDVKRLPLTHYLSEERELLYGPCPDIIIHKRGTNEHNAVVIEAKKTNSQPLDFWLALDLMKLTCFMEYPLKYSFGMLLVFDVDNENSRLDKALLISASDTLHLGKKAYQELQTELQNVWWEMRAIGFRNVPNEIRQAAIDFANNLPFANILAKCREQIIPPAQYGD